MKSSSDLPPRFKIRCLVSGKSLRSQERKGREWNNFLKPCQGKVGSSVTLKYSYCSHKEIQFSIILSALGPPTPKLRNCLGAHGWPTAKATKCQLAADIHSGNSLRSRDSFSASTQPSCGTPPSTTTPAPDDPPPPASPHDSHMRTPLRKS